MYTRRTARCGPSPGRRSTTRTRTVARASNHRSFPSVVVFTQDQRPSPLTARLRVEVGADLGDHQVAVVEGYSSRRKRGEVHPGARSENFADLRGAREGSGRWGLKRSAVEDGQL